MSNDERTVYGIIKKKAKDWGPVFAGISLYKAYEYGILRYIPLDPMFAHILAFFAIVVSWAMSDMVDIDWNERARFWK